MQVRDIKNLNSESCAVLRNEFYKFGTSSEWGISEPYGTRICAFSECTLKFKFKTFISRMGAIDGKLRTGAASERNVHR